MSKSISLQRARRQPLAWAMALFAVSVSAPFIRGAAPELTVLEENGAMTNRINFVVLSEGFTETQLPAFREHARTLASAILNTPPFSAYRNYFNAFAISVASNESGSDHPSQNVYRDTYFSSSYGNYGTPHLLMIPPNEFQISSEKGQDRVDALIAQFDIPNSLTILLVNDFEYGGSGGVVATTSLNPDGRNIAMHELGHSLGGLGEEYEGLGTNEKGVPYPNTTRATERDLIPWREWIEPSTPVPTPERWEFRSAVGAFEGAYGATIGWYRPKLDCKMRTVTAPFCEVCSQTLIGAIHLRVRLFEQPTPIETDLQISTEEPLSLAVEPLQPIGHDLRIRWSVDGTVQDQATMPQFEIAPGALAPGAHEARVELVDDGPWIRLGPDDPMASVFTHSRAWNIVVGSSVIAPRLEIESTPDGRIRLSWTGKEFELQETRALTPSASWTSVASVSGASPEERTADATLDSESRFYRLIRTEN